MLEQTFAVSQPSRNLPPPADKNTSGPRIRTSSSTHKISRDTTGKFTLAEREGTGSNGKCPAFRGYICVYIYMVLFRIEHDFCRPTK